MNNREKARAIEELSYLLLKLLAAQKLELAVQTIEMIQGHAKDIIKSLSE